MAALATVGLLAVVGGFVTDWTTVVKPASKQVTRLEILKDGDDHPSICSGVVLNKASGFLLTAAHCIPTGEPDSYAITVNGRHALLARVNRLLDLAVVRFSAKDEEQMLLAENSGQAGDEIAVAGFSFGVSKITVQFGRISQPYNEETKTVWADAHVIPGTSGGAFINIEGKLAGMTSRIYYSGPSSIGAAIPVEVIKDFVLQYLPVESRSGK